MGFAVRYDFLVFSFSIVCYSYMDDRLCQFSASYQSDNSLSSQVRVLFVVDFPFFCFLVREGVARLTTFLYDGIALASLS